MSRWQDAVDEIAIIQAQREKAQAEVARLTADLHFQSEVTKNLLPYQDEAVQLREENERMRKAIRPEHDRLRTLARKAGKRGKSETADEFDARADAIDFGTVTDADASAVQS